MWLALLFLACETADDGKPSDPVEDSAAPDDPADTTETGDTADTAPPDDTAATEVCDGADNDGDGLVDAEDPDCEGLIMGWLDEDGDGYGSTYVGMACPGDYAGNDDDCDDTDPDVSDHTRWYVDADDDGWGDSDRPLGTGCDEVEGTPALRGGDCDDLRYWIYPGAPELCDGEDDDCDGLVDGQDGDVDAPTWYADDDGDGYGDAADPLVSCNQVRGYEDDADDCDDARASVNPAATEVCGGLDDDCDGLVDDDDPIPADAEPWFDDADGDGEGDPTAYVLRCVQPAATVEAGHDCDDADPTTYACPDSPDDGAACADAWGADLGGVPAWTGTCDTAIGLWEHEGHCYWSGEGTASVGDARATCAAAGGHLATVQSTREDDALTDAVGPLHLGGCREDGAWTWFTGEAWGHQRWYAGEPGTDDCVMDASVPGSRHRWGAVGCTRLERWACEFGDVEVADVAEEVTPDCATATVSPAAEALDVARDGTVTVTFDADVDAATVSGGLVVTGEVSGVLDGTVAVDGATSTWTPTDGARAGERVTAVLSAAVRCADGGAVTPKVWSWFAAVDAGASSWSSAATWGSSQGVALGDFDGDAALEVALADGAEVVVLDGAETGTATTLATLSGGTNFVEVVALDADGDGAMDLAAVDRSAMSLTLWLGDGSGGFTEADVEVFDDGPTDVDAADLDADGDVDLVVALGDGTAAYTWLRNDGGDLVLRSEDVADGSRLYRLAPVDADADGDVDLAGALYDSSTLDVRWNDGADRFSQGPTEYDRNLTPLDLWAGDLDGDGAADLAATGGWSAVMVFLGDASGDFDLEDEEGSSAQRVSGGDLDGDGDLDLVVDTQVYLNDGDGDVASGASFTVGASDVAVADVDGDGVLDVVTTAALLLGVR